jgi:transmembrane sensor
MNSQMERLCVKAQTNELTSDEKAALEKWLDQSEANRKEYAAYSKIVDMQKSLGTVFEPDVELAWNKFVQSRQSAHELKRKPLAEIWYNLLDRIRIPIYKPIGAAAGIAIILLCTIWVFHQNSSPHLVESKKGEVIELTLPDGSQVTLNGESKLEYPQKFNDYRKVALEGEAFFKVVKNSTPFIVKAAGAQVKVLGTRFSVWTHKDLTRVVVEQGRVRLSSNNEQAFVEIADGQMSYVKAGSPPIPPGEVNPADYLGWLKPKLAFTDESLEKIIGVIEEHYSVSIEYEPELGQRKLSATFKNQSLETVLEAVCTALNLNCEMKSGEYYLSGK